MTKVMVLRKVLEASAIEFHDWVDYQYQNTCLMVITKEGLKVEDDDYEDFFEDPNTSERNRVSPGCRPQKFIQITS